MKKRQLFRFLVVLVAILVTSSITLTGEGPTKANLVTVEFRQCLLGMVDNHLFPSGDTVSVYAVSTRVENCPGVPSVEGGVVTNHFWLTVQRWAPDTLRVDDPEWLSVDGGGSFRLPAGISIRQQVALLTGLRDGRYRLLLVSGRDPEWFFLDAINFVIGGTGDDPLRISLGITPQFDSGLRTPSIRATRQAYGGKLYFGGFLSTGFATGFVYQVQADKTTEVLPVQFRQIGSRLVVELPNNSFDGTRPIYASITADGGITIQSRLRPRIGKQLCRVQCLPLRGDNAMTYL